jgi:hypothetical protein
VIELECGITVYPAREEQGRWRAVWHENGERQQCEAASEDKLAARLAKVTERLSRVIQPRRWLYQPASPAAWPVSGYP